jgi:hypothetical protein
LPKFADSFCDTYSFTGALARLLESKGMLQTWETVALFGSEAADSALAHFLTQIPGAKLTLLQEALGLSRITGEWRIQHIQFEGRNRFWIIGSPSGAIASGSEESDGVWPKQGAPVNAPFASWFRYGHHCGASLTTDVPAHKFCER